jgi:hypothetical protein
VCCEDSTGDAEEVCLAPLRDMVSSDPCRRCCSGDFCMPSFLLLFVVVVDKPDAPISTLSVVLVVVIVVVVEKNVFLRL